MSRRTTALASLLAAALAAACADHQAAEDAALRVADGSDGASGTPAPARDAAAPAPGAQPSGAVLTTASAGGAARTPNELGRIPVLEYHLLGEPGSRWKVERRRFREQLELLYARGYRPVNMTDLLDKKLDLPAGLSPVVIVFDDASPSQFSYVETKGALAVDPTSAVGMLLDMHRRHPDWARKGVFCMLPAAQQGHAFFGEKGIAGQKSEWRFQKVRFLHEQGFELCNHTLYHANLGKQTDAKAQEFIARGEMAIDSAVPGYKVRTFALPLGVWPRERSLARAGAWVDPRTKRAVRYRYDAVLEVAGGPTRSPHDPQFDPYHVTRVEVFATQLEKLLDQLDKSGTRYVSDGDPRTVARPTQTIAAR
jgi:peptidoglycan/xylan/chitin deacetylase (PgdA/CDA1 family)